MLMPPDQAAVLEATVRRAATLAAAGEAQKGYEVLVDGFNVALTQARQQPWRTDLICRWYRAYAGYREMHVKRTVQATPTA